jgi:ABC-type transporter Mla MlaB component
VKIDADLLSFEHAGRGYARVDELIADGRVELGDVHNVDSAGIALLLEMKRRAQRSGRSVEFVDVPPQLGRLLGFFGIDTLLGIKAS